METKAKILDSAFKLLAEKGTSFSLTDVATEVGIKKASIYAHYESKEIIISEVISQEISKYFFQINQQNDDLKKIYFSILDYYQFSQVKLLFWKRLLLLPSEDMDPQLTIKIQQMSEERFEIVKTLIIRDMEANIIKQCDVDDVALMFFSLIHGLLSSALIYRPKSVKEHYEQIWTMFWNSITK